MLDLKQDNFNDDKERAYTNLDTCVAVAKVLDLRGFFQQGLFMRKTINIPLLSRYYLKEGSLGSGNKLDITHPM